MRICYVCNEYPPRPGGGIGTFVHALARGAARAGHDVTVLGWGPRAGVREDDGVQVVTFAGSRLRYLSWLLDRRGLRRRLRAGRFDVVEVPEYMGPLPFALPGTRVVVRLHGSATGIARHRGARSASYATWCERRTLARHRHWAGATRHVVARTRALFGLAPERADVVLPPVERPAPAPSPSVEGPYVLFAGSLHKRKGIFHLADAARLFARDGVRLVYAGEAPPGVEDRIARMAGGADRVLFVGRVARAELFSLMEGARVFAFPSTIESFGLVVAEAMLAGTPVVVSNRPPFTEYVRPGETGLLVDPTDPEAIADAVGRLLADDRGIGARARRWAEETLSPEAAVARNLALYTGAGGLVACA